MDFLLLWARHNQASGAEFILGVIFLLVIIAVVVFRESSATYNVVSRRGVPYCIICGRQVSYRRDYCRACGYRFKTYSASSGHTRTPSPPPPPSPPKPFIDPATAKFFRDAASACKAAAIASFRGLVWLASCRWLDSLPEWLEPIGWGVLACGPVAGAAIYFLSDRTLGALAFAAIWCALSIGAIIRLCGAIAQHRKARATRTQEDVLARFAERLFRELKTQAKNQFDLDAIAREEGIDAAIVRAATEKLYATYADQIAADGIITRDERARIDQLAAMLHIDFVTGVNIERAAKLARYRRAVADVLADGVVTQAEKQLLMELRLTLDIPNNEPLL
jgi:hypothetical protein